MNKILQIMDPDGLTVTPPRPEKIISEEGKEIMAQIAVQIHMAIVELPELVDDMEEMKNSFIPSVAASFNSVNRQTEINQRLLERMESVVTTQESQIINLTEALLKQEATIQEQTLLIQQLLRQEKLPPTNTRTTEIAPNSPFILISSKKTKKATSVISHPHPAAVAPVVPPKRTKKGVTTTPEVEIQQMASQPAVLQEVQHLTTERSYTQALKKNLPQVSLAQIVKIKKNHDPSPLVKITLDFNLTLKAQQSPVLSIQQLINKTVGVQALDISVINRKTAVITISETQRQIFRKLEEYATPISPPKWSERECQRLTLLYNRAYFSQMRDSALVDLTTKQKQAVLDRAIDVNEESLLPRYLKNQRLKTIQYDRKRLLKTSTEEMTADMRMMEVDPVQV
jgi:hypothetical protein